MKRFFLALLLLVLVVVGGAAAGGGWWLVNAPASASDEEVVVEIPKGAGTAKVATILDKNGLVLDPRLFKAWVRITKKDSALRAGEFLMRKDMSVREVLDVILRGELVLHKITVPEGVTAKEIAALVEAKKVGSSTEFLALVEDAAFARSLGVPADRLEGYLFPDTYSFPKNAGARAVATSMVKRFLVEWKPEYQQAVAARGLSTHEAVTLASIVEKETGTPSERPIIAGVFYNRLRKGMKLESDPTIIYGMTVAGAYDGNIRKKDIKDPANVYNTYVIKRLPPGPIASPGAEALRAVAFPQEHEWLFFVATGLGDGAHVFTKTYKEHQAAVKQYLVRTRQARRAARQP